MMGDQMERRGLAHSVAVIANSTVAFVVGIARMYKFVQVYSLGNKR